MSITSSSVSSRVGKDDEVMIVGERTAKKKILEEEEYLGRMAKIIRRDFFSDIEFPNGIEQPSSSFRMTDRSNQTPGTNQSRFSTTSSLRSRREACSLSLNEFLQKYTSEDNAYFEKLQRKELKRHKANYPWLYRDKGGHNKTIQQQLKLPSLEEQVSTSHKDPPNHMIDWPHNPKNTLFYVPENKELANTTQSVINYHSNKYINDPIFKEPRPVMTKQRCFKGSSDKIGIDGRLLDGSENSSAIPVLPLLLPNFDATPRPVIDSCSSAYSANRFYIPNESPRDELAHRLYEEKVAKVTRTPKTGTGSTPSLKTPSYGRGLSQFSFSPERVKTPARRRNH